MMAQNGLPAVYTDAQAREGVALYFQSCSTCHVVFSPKTELSLVRPAAEFAR